MKKLALFVMLAIMAVACVKHEITPEIKCEVDEVSVPVSGTIEEDVFVSFSSNVKWTAAIKEVVDWCQVTPESGEAGDAKVRLIVAETDELDPREVTLIITAGVATKEIKVVQGQVDAFELVTDSEEVGPEGASVQIKANTNVGWTVSIPSDCDWVEIVESKAYGEQTKTVAVSAFDVLDGEREVTLAITTENGLEAEFTIYQEGPSSTRWAVDLNALDGWNYVNTTMIGETSLENTVSIALYDGKVVICNGDGSAPVLLNKETGAKEGVLATDDFKPYLVRNDDAGNLVMTNRIWGWDNFQIRYMKPGDKTVYAIADYAWMYLGGGMTVRGDVTKKALLGFPTGNAEYLSNSVLVCEMDNGKNTWSFMTVTGFLGVPWMAQYGATDGWFDKPENFPAFAFLGNDRQNGAFITAYSVNQPYLLNTGAAIQDGSFTATGSLIAAVDIFDENSNTAPNSVDIRQIGADAYTVISGAHFYHGAPQFKVVKGTDLTTLVEVNAKGFDGTKYSDDSNISTAVSTSVAIEGGDGTIEIYSINNTCATVCRCYVSIK